MREKPKTRGKGKTLKTVTYAKNDEGLSALAAGESGPSNLIAAGIIGGLNVTSEQSRGVRKLSEEDSDRVRAFAAVCRGKIREMLGSCSYADISPNNSNWAKQRFWKGFQRWSYADASGILGGMIAHVKRWHEERGEHFTPEAIAIQSDLMNALTDLSLEQL